MEPIELGSLTLYPLGIAVALLLIPFFFLAAKGMKKRGLKPETASIFAVLAIPLCFILARLGYCLLIVDQLLESEDFGQIFRVQEGGFLLWGAIGGLLLAGVLAGRITRQSAGSILDSAVLPACLMIAAIRLLCGLLFTGQGAGFILSAWFDPEEADYAYRYSLFRLQDWSFFERFPFAVEDYYGEWCWAIFVLEALWACVMAFLTSRADRLSRVDRKAASLSAAAAARNAGAKTVLFLILYASAQLVLEAMHRGHVLFLPWQGFVKANLVLCAVALVAVMIHCLRRLPRETCGKSALLCLAQFLPAVGVIVAMEFAAFEKKITLIDWLPADACHLLMALACLWIALSLRALWKKAYPPASA